jgi:hypothetical protein
MFWGTRGFSVDGFVIARTLEIRELGRLAGRVPQKTPGGCIYMRAFKTLRILLLSGALITPAALMAFQQSDEKSTTTTTTTTETHRYYDSTSKEYHNWDANEDRAYHMYVEQTHRTYEDFPKIKTTEQTEYWKWRHDHPDKVIFKSETQEQK